MILKQVSTLTGYAWVARIYLKLCPREGALRRALSDPVRREKNCICYEMNATVLEEAVHRSGGGAP